MRFAIRPPGMASGSDRRPGVLRRPGTYTRCAVRAPMADAVLTRYDALRERAGDGDEEALPGRQQTSYSASEKGLEAKVPRRSSEEAI